MGNKYIKLRDKHQKEVNDFPIFFAFSKEQLQKGLDKWNITKDDLITIGMGGFIQDKDKNKYFDLIKRHWEEDKESRKSDEYVYQMFRYELGNHEYCITYDYTETLEALGLEFKDLDKRMIKILLKAKEDYLKGVE